jgi:hydroxymethylbilane synthase
LIPSIVIGTRRSRLAVWQAERVSALLRDAWPGLECELQYITTTGDRDLDRPLPEIGGKGLFTAELEHALRAGSIDLAVHSCKDLPVEDAPGLCIGAICSREDARDVLIARHGQALGDLAHGARVGTCSLRRTAQLLFMRPDLNPAPLRGNVDTRIKQALHGEYDAIVLAAAGVLRLGLGEHISQYLPYDQMLPAPGQGALAIQCRADDAQTLGLLASINDAGARACVTAERAFLQALGGGCSAPIAALAQQAGEAGSPAITLHGLVASADGTHCVRVSDEGTEAAALGASLAAKAWALGASELL